MAPQHEECYLKWSQALDSLVRELADALDSDMKEPELADLVNRLVQHYEDYYQAKGSACQQDILQILTPPWRTPLEKAFMWLGGWRPSTAFQLVYALAGHQIEVELAEILDGVDTPTFASLSASQLSQLSDLQTATIPEEECLAQEMALLQEGFAERRLLALALASSGAAQAQASSSASGDVHKMDSAISEKLRTLQSLSVRADSLRFSTLKRVLDLLQTFQKAQYLVAAAKLRVALGQVGYKLDMNEELTNTVNVDRSAGSRSS